MAADLCSCVRGAFARSTTTASPLCWPITRAPAYSCPCADPDTHLQSEVTVSLVVHPKGGSVPISASAIGTTTPPVTVTVERGRLQLFAKATGQCRPAVRRPRRRPGRGPPRPARAPDVPVRARARAARPVRLDRRPRGGHEHGPARDAELRLPGAGVRRRHAHRRLDHHRRLHQEGRGARVRRAAHRHHPRRPAPSPRSRRPSSCGTSHDEHREPHPHLAGRAISCHPLYVGHVSRTDAGAVRRWIGRPQPDPPRPRRRPRRRPDGRVRPGDAQHGLPGSAAHRPLPAVATARPSPPASPRSPRSTRSPPASRPSSAVDGRHAVPRCPRRPRRRHHHPGRTGDPLPGRITA